MELARDSGGLRLFGLDLSPVVAYLRAGFEELMQRRVLRWLSPEYPVRLVHPDGSESIRLGVSGKSVDVREPARHVALELAEENTLRRSLVLPLLAREELQNAASIDAAGASPFAESDLVWAHVANRVDANSVRVDIALTSRRIIEKELAAHAGRFGGIVPEVWFGGAHPIAISGYGEDRRLNRARRERRVRVALAALIVVQLVALAVTPTLQRRAQALSALAREATLKRDVRAQLQKREELSKLAEQLNALHAARGEQRDLVWVINEITHLLPDDASLSRLELAGTTARLAGLSDNAAQLIETLSANPSFRDVRAPAGIARARGSKESFTIEFSVLPAPGKP